MMKEPTVDAAIPVLEWVGVDEPECLDRRGDHWVHLAPSSALIILHYSPDQRRQVFCACADVIGDRRLRLAIVFADETTLRPEAEADEACITNHDVLQRLERFHGKSSCTCRLNGLCPAPRAIGRGGFSFDTVGGATVAEQEKGGCAR